MKYRGIFINDEAPDLTGWIQEKFGTVPGHPDVANYGRGFYTNLFEVMLRLRANYLWPAMWSNAFNEDDPENPRLADEYGIVMGTSHQEPMLRSQQEWDRSPGKKYGNWNYNNTNQQPVLQQFWRDGIRRNKNFESIITLGLRAENDSGTETWKGLDGDRHRRATENSRRGNQSGPDQSSAALVPLQGSDGLLQRGVARAGRRDAALGRGQLGQRPPPAQRRRTPAQRRRGRLLSS